MRVSVKVGATVKSPGCTNEPPGLGMRCYVLVHPGYTARRILRHAVCEERAREPDAREGAARAADAVCAAPHRRGAVPGGAWPWLGAAHPSDCGDGGANPP